MKLSRTQLRKIVKEAVRSRLSEQDEKGLDPEKDFFENVIQSLERILLEVHDFERKSIMSFPGLCLSIESAVKAASAALEEASNY